MSGICCKIRGQSEWGYRGYEIGSKLMVLVKWYVGCIMVFSLLFNVGKFSVIILFSNVMGGPRYMALQIHSPPFPTMLCAGKLTSG